VIVALGVVIAIVVIGAAVATYAIFAPRRKAEHVRTPERSPLAAQTGWTSAAGDEFAGLSESARCDMIFAVAALDDDASQHLLEHALADPAEAVATAAAHALITHGRTGVVEAFLAAHPGERADRIAATLALLQ
jgi:hypothetical protein